jgi:hypothetical protein
MEVHGAGVATGQHEAGAFAEAGADYPEDVGRSSAFIPWRPRLSATPRPTAGDLILLADPSLIGEPNLYISWALPCATASRLRIPTKAATYSNLIAATIPI